MFSVFRFSICPLSLAATTLGVTLWFIMTMVSIQVLMIVMVIGALGEMRGDRVLLFEGGCVCNSIVELGSTLV